MVFDHLLDRISFVGLLGLTLSLAFALGYGWTSLQQPISEINWMFLLLCIESIGCLILLFILLNRYRQTVKCLRFMLKAIENDDASFRFPEEQGTMEIRTLHRTLNRMRNILFQAKQTTIQQEKYYSLILECIHTGILVVSDQGTIHQHNKEALRLLGRNILTHLCQLESLDIHLAKQLMQAHAGECLQATYQLRQETKQLVIRISEITIHGQHLRILTLNDIHTELDAQEMEAWIRLIRVLTHEIINNITPITSLSDTLLERIKTNYTSSEIPEGLETISRTGKGLLAFVDTYRRFTHIPQPQPSLFYVKPFLERMVILAQNQSPYTNIQFCFQIQPNDLMLYADEQLVAQVVTNILKNAIQAIAIRKNGVIRLQAYSDSTEAVCIEIANNGPAIPAMIASHIFIPFFTTKEGGSGIGLSLSRQIMRLSNGSLTLLSHTSPVTFLLRFN